MINHLMGQTTTRAEVCALLSSRMEIVIAVIHLFPARFPKIEEASGNVSEQVKLAYLKNW